MRLQPQRTIKAAARGFTLVEMIGVLAIIAILASLLIPRVFQAIGDSKISNAATTCNSIKAAVNEYYGKFGLIAGPKGAPLTFSGNISEDWDLSTLVAEGVAEKPFAVRIGNGLIGSASSGSRLRVINISANDTNTAVASAGGDLAVGAYNLDGTGATNDIAGVYLVEAVIEEVDAQDAKDFNDRIDGAVLGSTNLTSADQRGRVKYTAPASGKTSVRVYIAHR
jgi:prepilin-type N-terminal cleavage/methylation domain-containing protein